MQAIKPLGAVLLIHQRKILDARAHHLRVLCQPYGGGHDRILSDIVQHLTRKSVLQATIRAQDEAILDNLLDVSDPMVRHLPLLIHAKQGAQLIHKCPWCPGGKLGTATAALTQAMGLSVCKHVFSEPRALLRIRWAKGDEPALVIPAIRTRTECNQWHLSCPRHNKVLVLREALQVRTPNDAERGACHGLKQHQLVLNP
mmetsp:Transcript_2026/g.5511  ORF Transcript_2026/g.5511 Transcript_2026/m.5511 type:complete len:200 (-) Transcript_2026:869-1468(-)